MKILYHHRIASKDGQYVHIEELTRALSAMGHELIMVAPSVVERHEFGSDGGFVAQLRRYLPKAIFELLEFSYCVIAFWKLRKAVIEHRPDCLYERYNLYMPAGVWIKKRFKLPMISEVNAPLLDERSKFGGVALPSLARWSERYVWTNADLVLPVTNVLAERVKKEGVDAAKIVVIHNGINIEKFENPPDPDKAKEELGLVGKTVLGFTGFMREWHCLEQVVDMIAADKKGERFALLVGDGPARASIENRAQELGVTDRVQITGVVDRDRVFNYVAAFDIALQPNVVEYASPLKIFEYMALGKAIVAPNSRNIREILQDGTSATMFQAGDTDDFFRKVDELLKNSAEREELRQNARQTIIDMGFTWQENAKRVTELCEGLMRRG